MVIIRDRQSNTYGGFLDNKSAQLVFTLTKDYNIKVSASMTPPDKFELLIYGRRSEGEIIGDFLSAKKYFLQRPDFFDDSVEYHNPQWLVCPGKEA